MNKIIKISEKTESEQSFPNEEWIKRLKKYHNTENLNWANYVDFNVWFIPWLPGLPQSKISSLQERWWMVINKEWFWVYLIKMDTKEQVERAIEFAKDITDKILNKIWLDPILPSFIWSEKVWIEFNEFTNDKEMIFYNTWKEDSWEFNREMPTKNITPYMRVQDFYTDIELLEKNKNQLKQVEFFNNKVNLLWYLNEHFPETVPEWSAQRCKAWKMKIYLEKMIKSVDINYPIFVKSWIWASWSWLWKIDDLEEFEEFLDNFDEETIKFLETETVFQQNGSIIEDLEYSSKEWKWLNTRVEDMPFLVQENTIAEFSDPEKVKEKSINFFLDDDWVHIVTECMNNAVDWAYLWNIQTVLTNVERNKLVEIAEKIKKEWYRWPIWLDFFSDWEEIKIVEANPRNSWATNPQLLVYDINKRLNDNVLNHLEEYNMFNLRRASDEVKIKTDIKNCDDLLFKPSKAYWIIPQISLDPETNKQAIVYVFETDEQFKELTKEVEKLKIKKD